MKCFFDTLQPQVTPDTGLTSHVFGYDADVVFVSRWVLMYITDADVPHAQGVGQTGQTGKLGGTCLK